MAQGMSQSILITFIRLFIVLALCVVSSVTALTQETRTAARPDRGSAPGAAYSVSDIESISLSNGNLNLSIPLASLPPIAGGKLSLTLRATYNSKLWDVAGAEHRYRDFTNNPIYTVTTPRLGDRGGWHIGASYALFFRNAQEDFGFVETNPGEDPDWEQVRHQYFRAVLVTPDGAEHNLYPVTCSSGYSGSSHIHDYLLGYCRDNPYADGPTKAYYTADGTYISAIITPSSSAPAWTLYLPDGTRVTQAADGVQRITDTNGNSIKISPDNHGGTVYRDEQTNREIRLTYNDSVPGRKQYQAWYQTVGGVWQHVDINMEETQVKGLLYNTTAWNPEGSENGGGAECTHQAELGPHLFVVREIVFPVTEPNQPGQRYSFSYNSETTSQVTSQVQWLCQMEPQPYTRQTSAGVGELTRMQTPAGAVVNYTYADWGTESGPLEFPDPLTLARRYVSSKSLTHDGVTDTWNYTLSWNDGGGTVHSPDGSTIVESAYPHDPAYSHYFGISGKSGLVYRTVQSGQVMVERHWTLMPFSNAVVTAPGSLTDHLPFNAVVDAEYTSLLNAEGVAVKMSAKTFQYDYNGNLLHEVDYDWFDPALVARDTSEQLPLGLPTGVPASAVVLREVQNRYYNAAVNVNGIPDPASPNVYAKRPVGFIATLPTLLVLNALAETTIGNSVTRFSYDNQSYGSAPTLGNVTKVSRWDDVNQQWLNTSITYDADGNQSSITDAKGYVTQFFYEDATHSQPTRVRVDPLNGTGPQTALTAYDYSTGLVTGQTDANGNISAIDYTNQLLGAVDPFGRPGVVLSPPTNSSGSLQRHSTRTLYHDHQDANGQRSVTVEADLLAEGDGLLKSRTTLDQLNRTVLVEQSEDGASYAVAARTVYEQMGRITYTSNPSRGDDAQTDGWTRTTRDTLGRVVEVASFAGAAQPPQAAPNGNNWMGSVKSEYAANAVTVTDQAGRARRSETDAIGRLVTVSEDPSGLNYQTSYTYDPLGNLRTVQQGQQTRMFTYNSLSRLVSASNPESGAVLYRYDANGNLWQKTDARNIQTTYAYDALNRLIRRSYSDATPIVSYSYDTPGIANARGRLTSVNSSVSATSYASYDAMGRVTASSQATAGQTYSMSYEYDLAGNLKREIYPSGRVIRQSYDRAGRLAQVTGTRGAQLTAYASAVTYTAHGAVRQMTLGNTLIEQTSFNSRLQPTNIRLGTASNAGDRLQLSYDYGTTTNNGNVRSQSIAVPGIAQLTQAYAYDSLNRLTTASESGASNAWQQAYLYDDTPSGAAGGRYGNRRIDPSQTTNNVQPASNPTFNLTNNRIAAGQGYAYDEVGNLMSAPGYTFSYDAENRMVASNYTSPNQQANPNLYVYDGDGRRIQKVAANGQELTVYVYNVMGQMVAEYNNLLRVQQSETSYLTSDTLGTPRVITSGDGSVKSRHDYLPFGEEIQASMGGRTTTQGYSGMDNIHEKFTGKERDNETGLDYFVARSYMNTYGRFTAPDPYYPMFDAGQRDVLGYLRQPQNWNRYVYCINNPLVNVDPSGLDWYVEKGVYGAEPTWFEASPDKDKYEKVISYVYRSVDSGKYFALSPFGNQSASFDTVKEASAQYQGYILDKALENFDAPRLPDAVTANGGMLTAGLSFTLEAHGNIYLGMDVLPRVPVSNDESSMRALFKMGGGVSLIWLNQANRPSEAQADRVFSGPSVTAAFGYAGFNLGRSWSPGNGTTTNIGISTPGPSFSMGGSQRMGKIPFRWRN